MDLTSLLGLLSGIALIIIVAVSGDASAQFFNPMGLLIVFGGTAAASLLAFESRDLTEALRALPKIFSHDQEEPEQVVDKMNTLSIIARKDGFKKLQQYTTDDPFLDKMLSLLSDTSDTELFRNTARLELEALLDRHRKTHLVYARMASFAPAFGMLGTLIGLIKMLSGLNDPAAIGPGMAVALLTTFYGSLLATLFFLPVANKLKTITSREIINKKIIVEGGLAILHGAHPLLVYEQLNAFLPPRDKRFYNFGL